MGAACCKGSQDDVQENWEDGETWGKGQDGFHVNSRTGFSRGTSPAYSRTEYGTSQLGVESALSDINSRSGSSGVSPSDFRGEVVLKGNPAFNAGAKSSGYAERLARAEAERCRAAAPSSRRRSDTQRHRQNYDRSPVSRTSSATDYSPSVVHDECDGEDSGCWAAGVTADARSGQSSTRTSRRASQEGSHRRPKHVNQNRSPSGSPVNLDISLMTGSPYHTDTDTVAQIESTLTIDPRHSIITGSTSHASAVQYDSSISIAPRRGLGSASAQTAKLFCDSPQPEKGDDSESAREEVDGGSTSTAADQAQLPAAQPSKAIPPPTSDASSRPSQPTSQSIQMVNGMCAMPQATMPMAPPMMGHAMPMAMHPMPAFPMVQAPMPMAGNQLMYGNPMPWGPMMRPPGPTMPNTPPPPSSNSMSPELAALRGQSKPRSARPRSGPITPPPGAPPVAAAPIPGPPSASSQPISPSASSTKSHGTPPSGGQSTPKSKPPKVKGQNAMMERVLKKAQAAVKNVPQSSSPRSAPAASNRGTSSPKSSGNKAMVSPNARMQMLPNMMPGSPHMMAYPQPMQGYGQMFSPHVVPAGYPGMQPMMHPVQMQSMHMMQPNVHKQQQKQPVQGDPNAAGKDSSASVHAPGSTVPPASSPRRQGVTPFTPASPTQSAEGTSQKPRKERSRPPQKDAVGKTSRKGVHGRG